MTLPISVVIATNNRVAELATTLDALDRLEAERIIVVDNGSTDGTPLMVAADHPEVHLVRLPVNLGVPAFGVGVARVRTPYVLLLDDDATPAAGTLERIVTAFEADAQTAVVACHIEVTDGPSVTAGWPKHPVCFWGCGAGVRLDALVAQRYFFDPQLRLHGTEMDLAARLYADGHCVTYEPEAVVVHRVSALNRSSARRTQSLVAVAAWFPAKHLPLPAAALASVRHLGLLGFRAVRAGNGRAYVAGLRDAVRGLPRVLNKREPLPKRVASVYMAAVWEFEPLARRVRRALVGRPRPRSASSVGFEE